MAFLQARCRFFCHVSTDSVIAFQCKTKNLQYQFRLMCLLGLCFQYADETENKLEAAIAAFSLLNKVTIPDLDRAVFNWLPKNQVQSDYSDQSQQEQTARLSNLNSQQLLVMCSKRGKNHAHKVRFVLVLVLVLLLIG